MYTPDKWLILKIKGTKETLYKVLAGWSGSYLEGQSWKINSGITKVTEEGNYYLFEGSSGSIYKCHKKAYGTNMITAGILSKFLSNPDTKDKVEAEEQDFTKLEVLKWLRKINIPEVH